MSLFRVFYAVVICRSLMSNCAKFCKYIQISQFSKIPNLWDIFKAVREYLVFKDNFTKITNSTLSLWRQTFIWIEVFENTKILIEPCCFYSIEPLYCFQDLLLILFNIEEIWKNFEQSYYEVFMSLYIRINFEVHVFHLQNNQFMASVTILSTNNMFYSVDDI